MSRVYGYGRVSSREQDTSIAKVQPAQIAGYVQMIGRSFAHLYLDHGVSGSVTLKDRPEGAALLAVARKGDIVVATKLDRMFRSAHDALTTLEDLKRRGIALHLIDMGGDVTGNGVAKLLFTILAGVAEMERERIGERIRDAKAAERQKGKHLGGIVPFGFERVDRQLVPCPVQQEAIAAMHRLKAAGYSLRAIAAALGDKGLAVSHTTVGEVLKRAA